MIYGVARSVVYYRKVQRQLQRARTRSLYRGCGYGLKVMRSQIRQGKKSSRPGSPPKGHTKTLKRNMAFDVDAKRGEGTVGVVRLRESTRAKPLGGKSVPQVIDDGGQERLQTGHRVTIANFKPRPILDPVRETIDDKFRQFVRQKPI